MTESLEPEQPTAPLGQALPGQAALPDAPARSWRATPTAPLPQPSPSQASAEEPPTDRPAVEDGRQRSFAGASRTIPGLAGLGLVVSHVSRRTALGAPIGLGAAVAVVWAALMLSRGRPAGTAASGMTSAAPSARAARTARPAASQPKPPPAGMVAVAAGSYTVGCAAGSRQCWDDEKPAQRVALGRFGIMVHEVSAAQYAECVAAGVCPRPGEGEGCTGRRAGREQAPINCVTWDAAAAYCRQRGWQLPTEVEWEVAARGPGLADQPWGAKTASCELAAIASERGPGCGTGGPLPVGSRPADRSWVGALDMGGNVREWTASDYAAYPGGKADGERQGKVNRGASFTMTPERADTSHTRSVDRAGASRADLGFRCAVDL
ncbi:MAG: SUMF1/EgtB/PvdO family nonheme iron enzyme [Deltaproteobacteria bacterium]|nr:SUMF1/EgtB/PvdO family nonheme iron enzyme [Deltaproteobacteria bacterium]